jgi:hypothetical protein
VPVSLRQITPGNAGAIAVDDGIDEQSIVGSRPADELSPETCVSDQFRPPTTTPSVSSTHNLLLSDAFGLHAVRCGVPLNFVQRWLGHASMSTTAIYLQAIGPDERLIAARM